ncbi:hypothetical protein JHU04_001245 [Brenneria sp. 4F2]|nr:hypothetical protein [Brenneria bubanii]
MKKNERIIKFPLPDWNKPFVSNDDLDAYCVCYQYDVNEYGYGPYGFDTENSKKIIDKVFDDDLFQLSESGMEKISNVKLMKKKGFYVYSKLSSVVSLHCEVESYKKSFLKIKLKKTNHYHYRLNQ